MARFIAALMEQSKFGQARLAYLTLCSQVAPSIDHDTAVRLVAELGVADKASAWLLQAWGRAHNCDPAELEFETAVCGGDNPGALFEYRRRGKSAWGKLLAIRPCPLGPEACGPEGRLWFWVKDNNPIRHRQVTRNELKLAMGKATLVNLASKESFAEFTKYYVKPEDEADIRHRTGLTVKEFWRAVKKGDSAVVARLGVIPRRKRERMREAGMFVAPYVPQPTQMEMFR